MSGNTTPTAGGGISNVGILVLTNSTVSGNIANSDGGGILNNDHGTVTLTNSTVSGNSTGTFGGGILNRSLLILTNSTVSGNSANFDGGGIYNANKLMLTNSTVGGNNANRWGGGIYNIFGAVNVFNSTITNNRSDADSNGTGTGGGVYNGATFEFQNTILAGNFESALDFGECEGALTSNGNNLMTSFNSTRCSIVGSPVTLADPQLGPLQNNGGPTQTHALLAGSPAIDGNPSGCRDNLGTLLTTDQRGFPRPADGNNDSVTACDIGAFELQGATGLVSAVLPSSRSVQVGVAATAFATVINTGSDNRCEL